MGHEPTDIYIYMSSWFERVSVKGNRRSGESRSIREQVGSTSTVAV